MLKSLRLDDRTSGRRVVRFRFDGQPIEAREGESVATALLAAGIRTLRHGIGGPRGLFCTVGQCQECLVSVNGQAVEACRLPVSDGLEVGRR